jgi:hypothetical protein
MGLVAAVVIAVGGYFGVEFYAQHRVASEIETAFEQIRAGGGKASHGKVSFDARSRTVRIADIATETASQPPVSVKIASVTATGVGQPDTGRFSADSIEALDVEIAGSIGGAPGGRISYKMPRLEVKDYNGPAGLPAQPAAASIIEAYRSALAQFAAVSAASITAPTIVGTISNFGTITAAEFTYTGVALREIKAGKIASVQIERNAFTASTQQAGKSDKLTGEILNFVSRDIDASAMAAILDPQKANEDTYQRFYGQTTAGPYTIKSAQGMRMRIEEMSLDDISGRPSRLQIPSLLTLMPAAGATPTPAQARAIMERMANIYEGIRIGNAEMRGLSVDTPEGPFKLAAIRFNLENGKVGEFAIEGVDGRTSKGPVKVGRFALKSLDVAGLLRMAAEFSSTGQPPSPDKALALIPLIEGVEIKGVSAPFKDTGRFITLDGFDLNWGQFVGPIPSKAGLTAKFTTPVDATNPLARPLMAAGLDKLAVDGNIGLEWTEAARSFVLDVSKLDVSDMLKASARVSLANVPRQVFSADVAQAFGAAAQIEAGALELTLRDAGAVDFAIAQFARSQNTGRDAARQAILDAIKVDQEAIGSANRDADALFAAVARFVETPRQTLVIKLTPRTKVPVLQLFQLLKTDWLSALTQFRIEASTGL